MHTRILVATTMMGLFAAGAFGQSSVSTTVVDTAAPAKVTSEVGISRQDGISLSGADGTEVLVTRNGVTEVVAKELLLPNGIRVIPGGTVITAAGEKFTLRPSQILTFDGKLIDTTAKPVKSTTTTSTTTTTASDGANETSAEAIAAAEAERRRKATQESERK